MLATRYEASSATSSPTRNRSIALSIVVAVALGCCSASLAASAQPAKISPQFIVKSDKWCMTINANFEHTLGKFPFSHFNATKPDLKTLPLVGKHFAKALPIRRAIPSGLQALGEPGSGEQAWNALKSLALHINTVATKQVSYALATDTKDFVATVKQIQRLHKTLVAEALAAGFPKTSACGQVF